VTFLEHGKLPDHEVLYYNTNGPRCEGRGSWFKAKGSRFEARGPRALDLGPWTLDHQDKSSTGKCSSGVIERAWSWRRRMETSEFATIKELAEAVGLATRHVSRQLRLAYLVPEVLKRLTCGREASAVSLYDLCLAAGEAWGSGWRKRSVMHRPERRDRPTAAGRGKIVECPLLGDKPVQMPVEMWNPRTLFMNEGRPGGR
jgi:hypothetical protein